jgi:hypothetical protein
MAANVAETSEACAPTLLCNTTKPLRAGVLDYRALVDVKYIATAGLVASCSWITLPCFGFCAAPRVLCRASRG